MPLFFLLFDTLVVPKETEMLELLVVKICVNVIQFVGDDSLVVPKRKEAWERGYFNVYVCSPFP